MLSGAGSLVAVATGKPVPGVSQPMPRSVRAARLPGVVRPAVCEAALSAAGCSSPETTRFVLLLRGCSNAERFR